MFLKEGLTWTSTLGNDHQIGSPCIDFPGAGTVGVCHHAWVYAVLGMEPRACACQASILPTELYPQLHIQLFKTQRTTK